MIDADTILKLLLASSKMVNINILKIKSKLNNNFCLHLHFTKRLLFFFSIK